MLLKPLVCTMQTSMRTRNPDQSECINGELPPDFFLHRRLYEYRRKNYLTASIGSHWTASIGSSLAVANVLSEA